MTNTKTAPAKTEPTDAAAQVPVGLGQGSMADMFGLKVPDHGVIVAVISHSFGVVNSMTPHFENARTAGDLVTLHQTLGDAVLDLLNGDNNEGGIIREMGEDFQDEYEKNDGDLMKTLLSNDPRARRKVYMERLREKREARRKAGSEK